MAKTCRTCGFAALARECNRRHIWVSDKEFCGFYKPRETPLLVDELATALRQCLHYVQLGDSDVIGAAQLALVRYQVETEEVGDA